RHSRRARRSRERARDVATALLLGLFLQIARWLPRRLVASMLALTGIGLILAATPSGFGSVLAVIARDSIAVVSLGHFALQWLLAPAFFVFIVCGLFVKKCGLALYDAGTLRPRNPRNPRPVPNRTKIS